MRQKLLWLLAVSVTVIAPRARSQDGESDGAAVIPWREHFEQTLLEAREKNLPVFVAWLAETEPTCRDLNLTHYTDPRLVELLSRLPCLLASPDAHEPAEALGHVVCSRYGVVSCEEHRQTDEVLRNLLYTGRVPVMPQHLLLSGKGELLDARPFWVPVESLRRWLVRALKKLRPDLLPAKLAEPAEPMVETSLFDQLRAGDLRQRERAAQSIDLLDPDVVDRVMTTYAGSLEPDKRLKLLRELGSSAIACAPFLLSRQASSFDPVLRRGSAEGFTLLNTPQPLGILLDRLAVEADPEVKSAVITAVGRCGNRSAAAQGAVLNMLNASEPMVRTAVLLTLAEFAPAPEITTALLRNLDTTDRQLAAATVWSCGKMRLKEARADIEKLMTRFQDLRFQLLAELALKRIRGDNVDQQFYCEQRPIEELKAGEVR
ncbi:MAG: HEAT repeat domain-containing protein [Planctomycetota bacterium]